MRATNILKFIAGKLHQWFTNDDQSQGEWRKVPSE